jgi:hypothetical protein
MSIWDDFVSLIEAGVGFISGIPGTVVDLFTDPVETVGNLLEDAWGAASDLGEKVVDVFSGSPECLLFAGSPNYWQLVAHLVALKKTGALTSEGDCQQKCEWVAEKYPAVTAIPGWKVFFGCACKMAFSAAGADAALATAGGIAVSKLVLSAEDQTTGVISAVATRPGTLHLFARGADNTVLYKYFQEGEGWSPSQTEWVSLGGQIQQPPATASWSQDRLDIFVCGSDRSVWHKWYEGGWFPSLTGWHCLGGQLLEGPEVVAMGSDSLHLVARGIGDSLLYKSWCQGAWHPSLTDWAAWAGAKTYDRLRISAWGLDHLDGHLDLVHRGTDGQAYYMSYDARYGWAPNWVCLGGQIVGPPSSVSWAPGRLDIVVRGLDGAVYHKCWIEGQGWSPSQTEWVSLGGGITGSPTAVSWGPGRLDIVVRGIDGCVYHKYWDDAKGWYPSQTEWESLGGNVI